MSAAVYQGPATVASAPNESTRVAQQDTMLSPRFYTTDFDALDRVDVSSVREEWDALIARIPISASSSNT